MVIERPQAPEFAQASQFTWDISNLETLKGMSNSSGKITLPRKGTERESGLCQTQSHRENGVWHHQTGTGVQAISVERLRFGSRRMEPGLYWMEFKENACSEHMKGGGENYCLQNHCK